MSISNVRWLPNEDGSGFLLFIDSEGHTKVKLLIDIERSFYPIIESLED